MGQCYFYENPLYCGVWVLGAFLRWWPPSTMGLLPDTQNVDCAYAGNVSPHRRLQRKPLVSDPGMHHGTCVTHVPWCMSGSLTRGGGENVPGIPGAWAPAILRILQEAHVGGSFLATLALSALLEENITWKLISLSSLSLILQNCAFWGCSPYILPYCYLFPLLSLGWSVIAVCGFILVRELVKA